jgi:hypothetical protein
MLATLEFRKKMGPDGSPIEPRVQFTNGGTWSVNSPHPPHKPLLLFFFGSFLDAVLTTTTLYPLTHSLTLFCFSLPAPHACRVADNVCFSWKPP